jgi:hypothetical protein
MASARLEEIVERHAPSSAAWRALEAHSEKMRDTCLRELFAADSLRGERMTAEAAGIFLDYSSATPRKCGGVAVWSLPGCWI